MWNRDAVYAEIVYQAMAAKKENRFIQVPALVGHLNGKGLRRGDGRAYTGGRGSYRTVACAYDWADRNRGAAAAAAVAETFLTPDGRRAWDPTGGNVS